MPTKRQYWVFDLDGTLVDSFKYYLNFLYRKFSEKDVSFEAHEVARCLGLPAHTFLIEKLGETEAKVALLELKEQSVEDTKEIRPFAGITELLKSLKAKDRSIAVWTSREFHSANAVLSSAGLSEYVDTLVSSTCVENHKPHFEGLERISLEFGSKNHEMVMVGDHDFDMIAARNFGAYGLRASWHAYDPKVECQIAREVHLNVENITKSLKNS